MQCGPSLEEMVEALSPDEKKQYEYKLKKLKFYEDKCC